MHWEQNEKAELENMVQDIQEQLRVVSASLETQSCDMEARLKGLTSELENAKVSVHFVFVALARWMLDP